MDREEKHSLLKEFSEVVNMQPFELKAWLESQQSRKSSLKYDGTMFLYHTGQRTLEVQLKSRSDLEEYDFDHMNRAVGFIKRQMNDVPHGYLNNSQWRHSLMAWGYDPIKKL